MLATTRTLLLMVGFVLVLGAAQPLAGCCCIIPIPAGSEPAEGR
jgi:hypothetical protein